MLNEVDYDQPSTDSGEFVEVYNGGPNADLTNVAIAFVNGQTGTEYLRIALAPAHCLVRGGYLVLSDPAVTPTPGALSIRFTSPATGNIANAGTFPDGVALIDASAKALLDALSYGGSITAASLTGFPSTVNLVEGTATSAVDSSGAPGSLNRSPNGSDTDNASVDWVFGSTMSPGSPNGGSATSVPGACPNTAPQLAAIGDRSVTAGQTLSFTVSATDADDDALTYSASNLPAGAVFDPATRTFSWTPAALQAGGYSGVHFSVRDGQANSARDITITVDPPVVVGSSGGGGTPPPSSTPLSPGPADTTPLPLVNQKVPATAPNTRIVKVRVKGRTGTATFRGTGAKSFQCKLDKGAYKTCRSPKSYKRLKPGKHTLRVRAKSSAGTLDPTPAMKKFVVKR